VEGDGALLCSNASITDHLSLVNYDMVQ
jgi:hypothetical protein